MKNQKREELKSKAVVKEAAAEVKTHYSEFSTYCDLQATPTNLGKQSQV